MEYENQTMANLRVTAHGLVTPNEDLYMELTSPQQPPNNYQQIRYAQSKGATVTDDEQCSDKQKCAQRKITTIAVIIFMVAVLLISLLALVLAVFSLYYSVSNRRSFDKTGSQFIQSGFTSINMQANYCGPGEWNRVAYLNMSDPSQQCPLNWTEFTYGTIRACRRPDSSVVSCAFTYYSTINQYSRVCGRAIAYQFHSPDGFSANTNLNNNINTAYMDGISVTHGLSPRNHIWSFVAGVSERSTTSIQANNCPCSSAPGPRGSPLFVGGNYYCESGNPTDGIGQFFSTDKLWDGKQCEGTCCTGDNARYVPWFSVRLPHITTSQIEVRICGDESTSNENTPVELLEIYVQ